MQEGFKGEVTSELGFDEWSLLSRHREHQLFWGGMKQHSMSGEG